MVDASMGVNVATPAAAVTATYGDLKHGFQAADHGGWVLLDGRAVTALLPGQQTQAAALGFAANLPNAEGVVVMQKAGLTLGALEGDNSRALTIAHVNLPAVDLEAAAGGDHAHAVMAVTNDEGVCGFSELLASYTTDKSRVWSRQANTATANNQNTPIVGVPMETSGPHTHVVALGGAGEPIALEISPRALVANAFVFLGET